MRAFNTTDAETIAHIAKIQLDRQNALFHAESSEMQCKNGDAIKYYSEVGKLAITSTFGLVVKILNEESDIDLKNFCNEQIKHLKSFN